MPRDGSAWTSETLADPHGINDKALRVRRMFNGIAPRYELINSLFSGGRDAAWRKRAVELAAVRSDDVVLDVACGTGDFARAFVTAGVKLVVGCDFAHQMLVRAAGFSPRGGARRLKPAAQGRSREVARHCCEADALCLPFRSESFSITSCAFGGRNFADLDAGLSEMFRVLTPGGRIVILEFTCPTNFLVRTAYALYSRGLMPLASTLISGDRSGAYRYLPRSVVSFLNAEQMCARLRRAGFDRVKTTLLTMGIVTVYVAKRS